MRFHIPPHPLRSPMDERMGCLNLLRAFSFLFFPGPRGAHFHLPCARQHDRFFCPHPFTAFVRIALPAQQPYKRRSALEPPRSSFLIALLSLFFFACIPSTDLVSLVCFSTLLRVLRVLSFRTCYLLKKPFPRMLKSRSSRPPPLPPLLLLLLRPPLLPPRPQ
ncbi:hypothetical protein BDZ88DRAFT_424501 [Geranomyces variabilis]|nr:hypothetical protein BDZ88DRAFT_424501 [Geranomyces variabilis]